MEYEQRLFTKQPIDCLLDNKLERLKVSLIKLSLDNRRYKNDNRNADLHDLPIDGNEMLI